MTDSIRWGLIGLGSISRKFATGLGFLPDAEVYAVASRSQEKADAFGAEFGATKCYDSYKALANDPDVDVVYIGTPHTYHMPNTLLCLNAGKHVLCEKPFAVNRSQAQAMVDCARANNRFLMDAFCDALLPGNDQTARTARPQGNWRCHAPSSGFRLSRGRDHARPSSFRSRAWRRRAAGCRSLLRTIGVDGLWQTTKRDHFSSRAWLYRPVDELSATIFKYSDTEMATIATAIRLTTPHEARIMGSKGYIALSDWWRPSEMTVVVSGQEPETLTFQNEGNGFNYEAAAVGQCIRSGLNECDVMPLNETLAIMDTMDRIRDIWGLRYPFES